jgi:hypothetical protein
MSQVAMVLPPPKLWQDFEELTLDVAKIRFEDPSAKAYGNQGAAQNGVDVFCTDQSIGLVGIQCKRLGKNDANGNPLPGGLKVKHIDAEIAKAENFSSPLKHYVIATTDSRRTAIQDHQIAINAQRKQAGEFTFDVWFWDDFLGDLHKHSQLLQWYYDNILQLTGVYSFEHQILYLLQMAFSRAAFTTPIYQEGGSTELADALKDTEKALNTGQLKDRETTSILRVAPGGIGMIKNPSWSKRLEEVLRLIKEARSVYRKAKNQDLIVELSHSLEIRDHQVAQKLDQIRGDAVRELNIVLLDAGLNEVQSPL